MSIENRSKLTSARTPVWLKRTWGVPGRIDRTVKAKFHYT